MAIAALILGTSIVYVDAVIGSDWLDGLSWYQSNKPDGAQEVLSTIAGSAITVAGVVFSITIVSVSYAASQYGPRVLTNFMADRGNQVTLGTFIATFLYCLIILRTIRSGDEGDFVPDLAIIVALLLALCSIAVLIFFIHHVPRSIHVNSVVAGIGRQLIAALEERDPEPIGRARRTRPFDEAAIPPLWCDGGHGAHGAVPIRSRDTGYIEAIDVELIVDFARRSDLIVRLRYQPGDYIHAGRTFADAWPSERVPDALIACLQRTFAVGSRRTALQDERFLFDELVEIGTRALSSGVNDPFTAMTCLDWVGAAMSEAARREFPSSYRLDAANALRVIAASKSFDGYVDRAFGQFRQYLATDKNACLHALLTIERIAEACVSEAPIAALADEAEALLRAAGEALDPSLSGIVQDKAAATLRRLRAS